MNFRGVVSARFIRYILFGGFNTIVTYAIFLWMSLYIHFEIAYFIAFFSGIGSSYLMNSYFVFNRSLSGYTASMFALIYAAQYLYGSALLWVLVGVAGVEKHVAAALLIASSAVLTYLMLRTLFRRAGRSPQAVQGAVVSISDPGPAIPGPGSESRVINRQRGEKR